MSRSLEELWLLPDSLYRLVWPSSRYLSPREALDRVAENLSSLISKLLFEKCGFRKIFQNLKLDNDDV